MKKTYKLLIALTLFAGGFHFAYAAETITNRQETQTTQRTPQKQVTIIAQHFSSHYSTIAKSLSLSSLANNYRVVNMSLDDWQQQQPESELVISLGPTPLEELLKLQHKETVLAALITYQEWRELTSQYPKMESLSAIFYDPSPVRQIVLGKLLLPLSKSVGVMYSMENPFFIEEYEASLDAIGLSIETIKIKQTTEVARRFPTLSQQSDFIIAQPDPIIYNSQTLPKVLLSSYRQRKVIIGYSTGIVGAGAVATTYTNPEMLVKDLRESAINLLSRESAPFIRHSKYYDIKYNSEVARSLGLDIITKDQLQSEVDKLMNTINTNSDTQREKH